MFDRSRSLSQQITLLALFVFLLSPILILVSNGSGAAWPTSAALFDVVWFTFLQALVSAVDSVLLGVFGAAGLIWLSQNVSSRWLRLGQVLSALPNAAPVIVLLLAVLKFFPDLKGFNGIVAVHCLLNTGIVSIALARIASEKLSLAADQAWIEGASKIHFATRAIPMLKNEIIGLFLFVFALCFSSFAVPLVIGGSRATVIEVLIFEKIRINGDWAQAIGLSFIQILSVFALSVLLARETHQPKSLRPTRSPLLGFAPGLLVALAPGILIIVALLDRPWQGFTQLIENKVLLDQVFETLRGTLVIGVGVFALVSIILSLLVYANPKSYARKFLLGYAAPTSVLTGFAMLILYREFGWASYLKIIVAISLVSVPALYRFRLDGEIQGLKSQRDIAETLGASTWQIFSQIVFPQVSKTLYMLSGLAMIWSLGDFALSGVIAERDLTLAMLVESLMGSYRLDIASFLILSFVVVFGFFFLLIRSLARDKDESYVGR